jgi:hypothetical protein
MLVPSVLLFVDPSRVLEYSAELKNGWAYEMNPNSFYWYLVDAASSHMLVSKIKPCMSKFSENKVKPRMAHYISYGSLDCTNYLDNCGNSRAIHALDPNLLGRGAFIRSKPIGSSDPSHWWLWITLQIVWSRTDDESFMCLPYQLSMVGYAPTMVVTESGFDSGEGVWETATTSKEGSRRANYPLPARGGSDEK